MGRQSPGKWIRNLLLGKKKKSSSSSKSNSSKKKDDIFDVVFSEANANATKRVVSETVVVVVSGPSSNERVVLSIGDENANAQDLVNIASEDHSEEAAAIIAQAAFRGYQARRTFRILKAIIPLQGLIRGELVRREAVSALYCVKGIVKIQALARGYNVRHSGIGIQVQKICKDPKCSSTIGVVTSTKADNNVFVHKLLASSPSAVSLHLKYDYRQPNLAWEWLDRWTRSHFSAPLPEPKKLDTISDGKIDSCQTVETNEGQVERNAPKEPEVTVDDGSVSNSNIHIRHPKKGSNISLHSAKVHSQRENEKSNSKKNANEERKHVTRESSDDTATDASKLFTSDSAEKINSKPSSDLEKSIGHQAEDVDHHNNVNHKNFKRRASLPSNFINRDNFELQNTPSLRIPSYMAPTESAKAKLRGQGSSPRLGTDLVDKNGINKRLSLSSSLNGKLGLCSPRSERFAAVSGKGLIKTDRSQSSSRDWTDKLIQPQWRR